MATENYKVRDVQPTVLRLNPDLRHRLMRDAKAHGRSLSKEIEVLLQEALGLQPGDHYQGGNGVRPSATGEPGLTEMESAVLAVFRRLPPEKQLALLSLFK